MVEEKLISEKEAEKEEAKAKDTRYYLVFRADDTDDPNEISYSYKGDNYITWAIVDTKEKAEDFNLKWKEKEGKEIHYKVPVILGRICDEVAELVKQTLGTDVNKTCYVPVSELERKCGPLCSSST